MIIEVLVFPNPSDGLFRVQLEQIQQQIEVELFDMQGRRVASEIVFSTNSVSWNPAVSEGVYQAVIRIGRNRLATRWTKLGY